MAPATVHQELPKALSQQRVHTLNTAFAVHPKRFKGTSSSEKGAYVSQRTEPIAASA
jgi:hypothetical protein